MNIIKKVIIGSIISGSWLVAQAGVITQTFDSSWSIDVRDYYGDIAAMEWEYEKYTPWDDSLGNLTSVVISTQFTGVRENANDALRIRSALFTGWQPVNYQYSKTVIIEAGDNNFSANWSEIYTAPEELAFVIDYTYFTGIYDSGLGTGGAWYYFESRTENGAHSILARTTLSYYYDPLTVQAPATLALFGLTLFFVSFLRKKK